MIVLGRQFCTLLARYTWIEKRSTHEIFLVLRERSNPVPDLMLEKKKLERLLWMVSN
jgi:hypothetical protein